MSQAPTYPLLDGVPAREAPVSDGVLLRRLVEQHHDFVWRSLRRVGVSPGDVDDAVQKVFLVASRRFADIEPGAERRFLFATVLRVAANERRASLRRRHAGDGELDHLVAGGPSPEKIAADRALLDVLLGVLPIDLRSVFILFELEQMTTTEIADFLELPAGTVASRLRRGRELVEAKIKRMNAESGGRP